MLFQSLLGLLDGEADELVGLELVELVELDCLCDPDDDGRLNPCLRCEFCFGASTGRLIAELLNGYGLFSATGTDLPINF